MEEIIKSAARQLSSKTNYRPKIGLVLGSGLGSFADTLDETDIVPYQDIKGFPQSTVAGHKGQFVIHRDVICMQGRFHYYEGYDIRQVTLPIQVLKQFGIQTLVLTNAAGGMNLDFSPGDLMLIQDHINLTGVNPLIGKNISWLGERFPDLSEAYANSLQALAEAVALDLDIPLKKGVYIGLTGPSYETPAEIQMLRYLGGDAVGMSTVAEAIAANHCGLKVLGLSCITNMAAGILNSPLNHQEVMAVGNQVKGTFQKLVQEIIMKIK